MPAREIKTRFRLEGEGEYKRAMKDAADAIKVLSSEEKLAKAQFEATGDAQAYAAEKARILQEEIKEQEKAVAAAEKAVKQLTDSGVKPNDKAMQDWQKRLNNAKTDLTNMQTELDNTAKDLSENAEQFDADKSAADEFGTKMDEVAKGIDFQNAIAAIDHVKEKLETIIKTAAKVAKGIWDAEADAGKWADDMMTAATNAGIDVETYQSWKYASMFIDTEVSSITSTITRLESDLGSSNEEIAKTFNQLSIRTRDASHNVRDATTVFWEIIDALGQVQDPTQRSIYAQKLLGKSWKDLAPLIEAGSKAYRELAEEGRKTAVVSEENVKALADFDDARNDLEASFNKLKLDTLAALAPTFKEVAEGLKTAVSALDEFVQSEEGQKALQGLNDALSGVIHSFLGDDNGQGTFESIVNTAKDAVKGFTDALNWVADNGETVKNIILGMAAAYGSLKIGGDVLMFLQLLQHTPLNKLTALFGKKAADTAAQTAAQAAAPKADGFTNPLAKTGTGLLGVGLANLGVGAAWAVGVTEMSKAINNKYTEDTFGGFNESMERASELMDEIDGKRSRLQDLFAVFATATDSEDVDKISAAWNQFGDEILKLMPEISSELHDNMDPFQWIILGAKITEGLAAGIDEQRSAVEDSSKAVAETPINTLERTSELMDEIEGKRSRLQDLFAVFATATDSEDVDKISAAWNQFGDEILKLMPEISSELHDNMDPFQWIILGAKITEGLAAGIDEQRSAVEESSKAVAETPINTIEGILDIHSPSRVMEIIGENASVGLANGIIARQWDVIQAARAVAMSAIAELEQALMIHSPSRVMMRLGNFTAEGFAEGIDQGISQVERAVGKMASATTRTAVDTPRMPAYAASAPSRAGAMGQGAAVANGQEVEAVIMMDKTVVGRMVAPVVNEAIGAIIQAQRG